jgi:hypothetical protein
MKPFCKALAFLPGALALSVVLLAVRAGASDPALIRIGYQKYGTLNVVRAHGDLEKTLNRQGKKGPGSVIGLPSANTCPLSGFSKPAMMLRSVVLPQPLGPTRQRKPPTLTCSETASSACTSPLRPVKNRFETRSTASFAGTTFSSSSLIDIKIERLNAAKISSSSSRRFEKSRDIRRGFHEARFLRIGDKSLHRRTRNFARENNALPRMRDQLR